MKERPIIFSGEMVRAIFEARKTMTRRPIKPQPKPSGFSIKNMAQDFIKNSQIKCPYGQPGDRLWVRETWNLVSGHYVYRADCCAVPFDWKPSIHMPRNASRINLEIINIKVERLQEITTKDIVREGFPVQSASNYIPHLYQYGRPLTPKNWFQNLWNSIYGKNSWNQNPWVCVIEFRRLITK